MSTESQQQRLFSIGHLLNALGNLVAHEHRAAADRLSMELAKDLDALFEEWRAGIPLTAALPTEAQLEADPQLQAAAADAEAHTAYLLEHVPATTRQADAVTVH